MSSTASRLFRLARLLCLLALALHCCVSPATATAAAPASVDDDVDEDIAPTDEVQTSPDHDPSRLHDLDGLCQQQFDTVCPDRSLQCLVQHRSVLRESCHSLYDSLAKVSVMHNQFTPDDQVIMLVRHQPLPSASEAVDASSAASAGAGPAATVAAAAAAATRRGHEASKNALLIILSTVAGVAFLLGLMFFAVQSRRAQQMQQQQQQQQQLERGPASPSAESTQSYDLLGSPV